MALNIEQIIDRLRNQSPLLGRNAREYIADALEGLFTSGTIRYGTSNTGANTAEKVVNNITPTFDDLHRGAKISITFTNGNTAANPRIRIGANTAVPIINLSNWAAGATVPFVFDGTNWRMVNSKRAATTAPLMDSNTAASIGTDNGQYANADHVH
ncbi:MAG: hypothetical protein FWF50_03015, partial [Defluviitaleaceae bacterium]|nr:hypothetical protein [Defluviitaleaceae bacterium]